MSNYLGTFQLTGSLSATDGESATIRGGATLRLAADIDEAGNGVINSQATQESLSFTYSYQGTTQSGTVQFTIPALNNVAVKNGAFSTFLQIPTSDPAIQLGITISGTFAPDQRTIDENFSATISGSSQGVFLSGQIQGPGYFLLEPSTIRIGGEVANQATIDTVSIAPFQSVSIDDPNPETSQTLTVTLRDSNPINQDGGANGILTNLGGGSYNADTGVYTITGTTAEVTAALHNLVFIPTVHQHSGGQVVTTVFKIGLYDNLAGGGSSAITSVNVTQSGPVPITLATMHSANGNGPVHDLAFDAAGNIFGVTEGGGAYYHGVVFEVAKTANGYASDPIPLVSATMQDQFINGVIVDADGNLIGTNGNTLYKIAKTGDGYANTPVTLLTLPSSVNAGVTADADGNLYGMLNRSTSFPSTPPSIFKVDKTAGGYATTATIIAQFPDVEFTTPVYELLIDADGNMFGTIRTNPYQTAASVFMVAKTADGYNDPVVLANFSGRGNIPTIPLVADKAGNLFGATARSIFEIVKTETGYNSTPVTLSDTGTINRLIIDVHGNLFGTNPNDGPYGNGYAFEILKTADGYDPSPVTLFTFDNPYGTHPNTGMTADATGNLFLTTSFGFNSGSVIELKGAGYYTITGEYITGTAGDDVLQSTPNDDIIDGAAGNDTVSYANAASGVSVNLTSGGPQNTAGAGTDALSNIENIIGSSYNDVLIGDSGSNNLSGGSGDDMLRGDGGANTLAGGDGTDTAAYAAAPWDYYVTANGNGGYDVKGPAPAYAGLSFSQDTLAGIERASFDQTGQTLTLAEFQAQSFNPYEYVASNPDLIVGGFGATPDAALQHFMQYGYFEGRYSNSFDPYEYVASNLDLMDAGFGFDPEAAAKHYAQHGYFEGRSTNDFDVAEYVASNWDLTADGYGFNLRTAAQHYVQHGHFEGRSINGFDASEYVASNWDLTAAGFGSDLKGAVQHYIQHGYFEGRSINGFDAAEYVASNWDLTAAGFGSDLKGAVQHYIQHGYFEGRSINGFNVYEYVASNLDMTAAGFGFDPKGATQHYIQHGYFEGRSINSFNAYEYVASNIDLVNAGYGNDIQSARQHYVQHGYFEGRSTNGFDPVAYLLSNPDLEGSHDADAALIQYVQQGYQQGRTINGAFGHDQGEHVLTLDHTGADTIDLGGDVDWFRADLTAGQDYTFTLSGADSAGGTLADPLLSLYSDKGVLLAQDDNGGPGHDALIQLTATTTGTVYLTAAGANNSTGSYGILAAIG